MSTRQTSPGSVGRQLEDLEICSSDNSPSCDEETRTQSHSTDLNSPGSVLYEDRGRYSSDIEETQAQTHSTDKDSLSGVRHDQKNSLMNNAPSFSEEAGAHGPSHGPVKIESSPENVLSNEEETQDQRLPNDQIGELVRDSEKKPEEIPAKNDFSSIKKEPILERNQESSTYTRGAQLTNDGLGLGITDSAILGDPVSLCMIVGIFTSFELIITEILRNLRKKVGLFGKTFAVNEVNYLASLYIEDYLSTKYPKPRETGETSAGQANPENCIIFPNTEKFGEREKSIRSILEKYCENFTLRIISAPPTSLRGPRDNYFGVIYQYKCAKCSILYIGQSQKRSYDKRIDAHIRGNTETVVSTHLHRYPQHRVGSSRKCFKIIDYAMTEETLTIKEGYYIKLFSHQQDCKLLNTQVNYSKVTILKDGT